MAILPLLTLCLVLSEVCSLPCLTSKAKQEFKNAREKLKALEKDIAKKVNTLDADLQSMETDLQSKMDNFIQINFIFMIFYHSAFW